MPNFQPYTFRIDPDVRDAFKKACEERQETLQTVVNQLLLEYIEQTNAENIHKINEYEKIIAESEQILIQKNTYIDEINENTANIAQELNEFKEKITDIELKLAQKGKYINKLKRKKSIRDHISTFIETFFLIAIIVLILYFHL